MSSSCVSGFRSFGEKFVYAHIGKMAIRFWLSNNEMIKANCLNSTVIPSNFSPQSFNGPVSINNTWWTLIFANLFVYCAKSLHVSVNGKPSSAELIKIHLSGWNWKIFQRRFLNRQLTFQYRCLLTGLKEADICWALSWKENIWTRSGKIYRFWTKKLNTESRC